MTIFTTLHRSLRIPKGYHIEGHRSVKAPGISEHDRQVAISKLAAAGKIGGESWEDIVEGICARLVRAKDVPGRRAKPIQRMNEDVVAAIVADPDGEINVLAARVGRDPKTIRRYRDQLRQEGRI
jgi:hypothetical protein